jgi:hypothetical protein
VDARAVARPKGRAIAPEIMNYTWKTGLSEPRDEPYAPRARGMHAQVVKSHRMRPLRAELRASERTPTYSADRSEHATVSHHIGQLLYHLVRFIGQREPFADCLATWLRATSKFGEK